MKHLLSILILLNFMSVTNAYVVTEVDDIDKSELYVPLSDDLPKIDTEDQVYMGDRMLQQRSGKYVECLVPLFDESAKKFGGWTLIIKANVPICKLSKEDKDYLPSYINGLASEPEYNIQYDVRLSGNTDGKYKICLRYGGLNGYCKKKLSSSDFKFTQGFISEQSSMQRVIEYAGKKDSFIKFIYSEYKDGYIRDAFTREFEVDLNEGNIVAYKGAVMEIIEATNATITYKVVRHFQE